MRRWTRKFAFVTLTLAAAAVAQAAGARSALLSADGVWTGDGKPHAGWAVLVVDGRVKEVGPAGKIVAPSTPNASPCPARR